MDFIIDQLCKELKSLPNSKRECIQHLIDLGYIPSWKASNLTNTDYQQAADHFMHDAKNSTLYTLNEINNINTWERGKQLCHLLRKATDLDEGILFNKLPQQKTKNLASRIIHYRLSLCNLWHHEVGLAFSQVNSMQQIEQLANLTKANPLDAINLMGDIDSLAKHLIKVHDQSAFIVPFLSKDTNKHIKNKLDRPILFKQQLKEDFGDRTNFFKYLNKEVLKNNQDKIDFDFLKTHANNKLSQFLLRLIQIFIWQSGFYSGRLDGAIGNTSLQSILNTIDAFNQADNKQIKAHRVLCYVAQDYFIINTLYFFQEYAIDDSDKSMDESKQILIGKLLESSKEANHTSSNKFIGNLNLLKTELQSAPKFSNGNDTKRVYYGFKQVAKKALRFSKLIFKWMTSKAKQCWDFLKQLFGHFFEQLKIGLRAFIDGLKFILGKAQITTTESTYFICTHFKANGDVHTISNNTNRSLILEQSQQIKHNITALQFTMALVGGVFKTIKQSMNVLSWPILLISIIKTYQNIALQFKNLTL